MLLEILPAADGAFVVYERNPATDSARPVFVGPLAAALDYAEKALGGDDAKPA